MGMKMSGDTVQKGEESRLLPLARLNGQEFLVDIENRQFRNFKNSDEVIEMHSQQGRQVLKDMQGTEWNCHGLFTGSTDKAEV